MREGCLRKSSRTEDARRFWNTSRLQSCLDHAVITESPDFLGGVSEFAQPHFGMFRKRRRGSRWDCGMIRELETAPGNGLLSNSAIKARDELAFSQMGVRQDL